MSFFGGKSIVFNLQFWLLCCLLSQGVFNLAGSLSAAERLQKKLLNGFSIYVKWVTKWLTCSEF